MKKLKNIVVTRLWCRRCKTALHHDNTVARAIIEGIEHSVHNHPGDQTAVYFTLIGRTTNGALIKKRVCLH